MDSKSEGKYDERSRGSKGEPDEDDKDYASAADGKYAEEDDDLRPPMVNILGITMDPPFDTVGDVSGPLSLRMQFELDRDCVAAYWQVRFLVDSCDRRLIKVRITSSRFQA
jgi:hypothetical protein